MPSPGKETVRRILVFSLAYYPHVGGAEIAIRELTDRFDPAEYEFEMITLRFDRALPATERIGNVTVHRIGRGTRLPRVSDRALPARLRAAKALFPIASFLKADALHRARRFDMAWAMMANQAGFAALLFKIAHPRVPYLLELQDGNSLAQVRARRPVLRLLWPLYRLVYRRADRIKAISRFIEQLARGIGYRGPVDVIPNGVDVARFAASPAPEHLAPIREKLGKRPGDLFLFTASRLVLSRGVEDVIRALPHLPDRVKLLIAGDGEDRKKLEEIARREGVFHRVIFAGHIDHGDLPAYFGVSDIFVRPSIVEGFGSAFVEAFAAGIPVVATPVGGIPDFLADGETGLFCAPRDPESVARAVRRYLDDPQLAQRVAAKARRLAIERYDWDLIARRMRAETFEPLLAM